MALPGRPGQFVPERAIVRMSDMAFRGDPNEEVASHKHWRVVPRVARKKRWNFEAAPREPAVFAGETRYVQCPASGHLHTPQALLVYPTCNEGWPAFRCSCQVFGYLAPIYDLRVHGYAAEDLTRLGLTLDGRLLDTEPPKGGGRRFTVCPMSHYLHQGLHGCQVQQGPKRFHCRCGCGTNWFLPRGWTKRHGYTLAQLDAMGATSGGA